MNNLIPEPRPDTNGKITTRWVRSTPANVNKALLAAPPAPVENPLQRATKETAPFLSSLMEQIGTSDDDCLELGSLNPLVAHRLEEILRVARENGPMEFSVCKADLGGVLYAAKDEPHRYGPVNDSRILHNFAALGSPKGESFELLVAGLRNRPEFGNVSNFLFELSPEDQKRAAALFTVTSSVDQLHRDVNYYAVDEDGFEYTIDEDEQYVALKSEELADFVLENPDLADDVIRIVNERGSTDVAMLREILSGSTPAIGSGIL
jgi:hypothetical protein